LCGRYSLTGVFEDIASVFNAVAEGLVFKPRYNVAPTDMMPVVVWDGEKRKMEIMRWGLVPSWAKDPGIGSRLINARLETLHEKPAFKKALACRRCLIPADGYYEWIRQPEIKRPYRVITKERGIFAFAGLWDEWTSPSGVLRSFTIVTTEPVPELSWLHPRMPLILPREEEERWLSGFKGTMPLYEFTASFKAEKGLRAYPVSTVVNSPRADVPECIAPAL